MKEFLDKISSYKIFNYLVPGILFSVLASNFSKYSLIQSDIITGLFIYYFIGMVISRIGSLVIEPILKKFSFIKFSNYEDYINSSKIDEKLDTLSEENNVYRTFSALFLLLLLLKLFENISNNYPILDQYVFSGIIIFILIIFLFSYRKQTQYIIDRINVCKNNTNPKIDRSDMNIDQEGIIE